VIEAKEQWRKPSASTNHAILAALNLGRGPSPMEFDNSSD